MFENFGMFDFGKAKEETEMNDNYTPAIEKRSYFTAPAERGQIREFIEKDETIKNCVLVVSSNERKYDKIVSIIMLRAIPTGSDTVRIPSDDGGTYYASCGLVTYVHRSRLGAVKALLTEEKMAEIDERIADNLGIKEDTPYKELYENLLEKVVSRYEPE